MFLNSSNPNKYICKWMFQIPTKKNVKPIAEQTGIMAGTHNKSIHQRRKNAAKSTECHPEWPKPTCWVKNTGKNNVQNFKHISGQMK